MSGSMVNITGAMWGSVIGTALLVAALTVIVTLAVIRRRHP